MHRSKAACPFILSGIWHIFTLTHTHVAPRRQAHLKTMGFYGAFFPGVVIRGLCSALLLIQKINELLAFYIFILADPGLFQAG